MKLQARTLKTEEGEGGGNVGHGPREFLGYFFEPGFRGTGRGGRTAR